MEKLSREERETHLLMCEVDDYVMIDTSMRTVITKCRKCGYELVREEYYPDDTLCSALFKAPKKAITFRSMAAMAKLDSKTKRAIGGDEHGRTEK